MPPPTAARHPTFAAVANHIVRLTAFREMPWSSQQAMHALLRPTSDPTPQAYAEILVEGQWKSLPSSAADSELEALPFEAVWREARRMVAEERPPADDLAEVREAAAANPAVLAEVNRIIRSVTDDHAALHAIRCWARSTLQARPRVLKDVPGWIDAVLPRWVWARTQAVDGSLVGDHATRENADLADDMIDVCEQMGVRPPGIAEPAATISHFALVNLANRLRDFAVDRIDVAGRTARMALTNNADENKNIDAEQKPRPIATFQPSFVGFTDMRDLIDSFAVPISEEERVRAALYRMRKKFAGDRTLWMESDDRGSRDAKYLYRANDLRVRDALSVKRPSK